LKILSSKSWFENLISKVRHSVAIVNEE